tara:strand:- start:576 stop:971 length:396 start_codon:yes stop_codon:yes gene_type:complete
MTKKNINTWRTEFDWMDPNDVQLEVIKNNTRIEEGELGPENKEARTLMSALVEGIEIKNPKLYEDEEFMEIWDDQGIGKDLFGKYAFTEFDHEGKTYQVHVREKSSYNNVVEIAQGRIIGPKLISNKKGMN